MKPELEASARAHFVEQYSREPDGIAFAPGRVNLIGEHIDYNDGLALPMPVAEGTAVAWARSDGEGVSAWAEAARERDHFRISDIAKPDEVNWTSYVRGMAAQYSSFAPQSLDLAIVGDLRRGSGMSSSASLCIALGRAFADSARVEVDQVALAHAAQSTEHEFAGVTCGIMDQMAIALGIPGKAMLLDCRDLSVRYVEVPSDWHIEVTDSGVTRGLVDGEYNLRRQQCEEATQILGIPSLRDATIAMLDKCTLPETLDKRARHVVTEIERVRQAVTAIENNDIEAFGTLLNASHASLRDLYEVSVPAVDDLVVAIQKRSGIRGGARIMGGGFGGSIISVEHRPA